MGAPFATHHVLFVLWFLATTFSLNFFKVESNSNVSCYEKDKQALLSFKQGLVDSGNVLSSWSDHGDCCRWHGVRCNNNTGQVTELHLRCSRDGDGFLNYEKRLGGVISHSLLELEHLNYLDLSENEFNCTGIPSFLGSMGSMRHLDLHEAGFCGVIPYQLGNLSSLHYLNLGRNFGLYADNLHWMSSLSSIQYLDLSSADLHREVDWLQIMSEFPSISNLILKSCHLDSLNPSLASVNFTSLRSLDLYGNHFNHEIPNWFSNLSTSLLELFLNENSLIGGIPPGILNFQILEYLDLEDNSLSGKIPESLGHLKHLKYLSLSINSLSGPIPSSIGNLSELQILSLGINKLNGTVPKSLGLLSNLMSLEIPINNFKGGLDEAHFTKLWKLKYLDISYTPLFFNVNSNWVPPFQLEYVSTSSCNIGPNFPTWLHTQTSLQFLLLPLSRISDKAPSWFWDWISNIYSVDLSNNHIEGDVPDILLNSTILKLRSNHFKGRLPRLSANVEVLDLAHNSFFGPISTFLCQKMNKKNKVKVLDVSNNFLLGELSNCWRYWQSLIHLNLGANNLSGRIPYSLGSLVELKSLSLQNNNIYGDIPSSLKRCSKLGFIDIGVNNFSRTIPFWITKLTQLIVLRLRSSGLRGNIPLNLCQISSLRILDLANNSLSGPIPSCFKNISAMVMPDPENQDVYFESLEYSFDYGSYFENLMLIPKGHELQYEDNLKFVRIIDLSSNKLSGSIPVEISVLSELRFLNLSRNHLMGNIPENIGIMKELESIDLSRNHLSDTLAILNCVVLLFQMDAHHQLENLIIEHQLAKKKKTLKVLASIWVWELDLQLAFGEFVEVSFGIGHGGMLISNLLMTKRIGFM
ncbi:receptor-like protein EIX1 isoform X2 [Quercus suber]|uniref:receptor-like protein EIX1 isoform X2 n=1 Tax=Quercus suber TaxID=58331 RepID=UPI0032DF0580